MNEFVFIWKAKLLTAVFVLRIRRIIEVGQEWTCTYCRHDCGLSSTRDQTVAVRVRATTSSVLRTARETAKL